MSKLGYVVLTRDEFVRALQTGSITISSRSRCIPDVEIEDELISKTVRRLLTKLKITDTSIFNIALFEHDGTLIPSEFTLDIFSIKQMYCLDNISREDYQRKFNNTDFKVIPLKIDFEEIIKQVNKKNNFEVLNDVFEDIYDEHAINEIDRIKSHDLIKRIIDFKREAKLPNDNISLLNDMFTLAVLYKGNENHLIQYKAGDNVSHKIVESFLVKNKQLQDLFKYRFLDFISEIKRIIESEIVSDVEKRSPFLLINDYSSEFDCEFDFSIFVLIYFKLKSIYVEESENPFEEVKRFHEEIKIIPEWKLSFGLYFSTLEYSDVYPGYYRFKKLDLFIGYQENFSKTELNQSEIDSSIIIEQFKNKLDHLLDKNEELEQKLAKTNFMMESTSLTDNKTCYGETKSNEFIKAILDVGVFKKLKRDELDSLCRSVGIDTKQLSKNQDYVDALNQHWIDRKQ
jgi:hypothetical protein